LNSPKDHIIASWSGPEAGGRGDVRRPSVEWVGINTGVVRRCGPLSWGPRGATSPISTGRRYRDDRFVPCQRLKRAHATYTSGTIPICSWGDASMRGPVTRPPTPLNGSISRGKVSVSGASRWPAQCRSRGACGFHSLSIANCLSGSLRNPGVTMKQTNLYSEGIEFVFDRRRDG